MKKLIVLFVSVLSIILAATIAPLNTAYAEISAPTNLSVNEVDGATILSWEGVSGNDGYNVYIDDVLFAKTSKDTSSINLSSDLVLAKTYKLKVETSTVGGVSQKTAVSYDHYIQYSSPSSLIIDQQKTLSWSGNAASYRIIIDRITIKKNFPNTSLNLSPYLYSPKQYTVSVQGEENGFYMRSFVSSTTYQNCVKLAKPNNLAVCALNDRLVFSFDKTPFATSYSVDVKDGDKTLVLSKSITSNYLDLTDYLTTSTTYTVSVSSVGGTGFISSEPATTTHSVYSSLASPVLTANGAILSWNSVENAVSYSLSLNGEVIASELTATIYDFSALISSVGEYKFSLQANAVNNFLQSPTATYSYYNYVTLATTILSMSNKTLSWGAIPNATSYTISINGTVFDNAYSTTTLNFDGLLTDPDTYTISVCANAVGYYKKSAAAETNYVLAVALTAPIITLTDKTLHWYAVLGAETYSVFVDDVEAVAATSETSIDLTAYLPGASHVIKVYANEVGNYLKSPPASVTYIDETDALSSPSENGYHIEVIDGTADLIAASPYVYVVSDGQAIKTDIAVAADGSLSGSDTALLVSGTQIILGTFSTDQYVTSPVITLGENKALSFTAISCAAPTQVEISSSSKTPTIISVTVEDAVYYAFYDGVSQNIVLPQLPDGLDASEYFPTDVLNPNAVVEIYCV